MRTFDLESLRCADALARTLRFRAAAQSCALSAAAFGKRVQQIEDDLGVALFVRTTRRVELTPDGARLLPRIRALLADAEALRGQARGTPPPLDIVIGTRHELGLSWLMPARAAFSKALPHATVHLRFGSAPDLEGALGTGKLDAAVLSRPAPSRRIEAVPLHVERYAVYAAPSLLRMRPLRTTAQAAEHTLIDADDALPLASYVRGARLTPARIVTLGTLDAIRAAVVAGEGFAVLPRYFAARDEKRRALVQVLRGVELGDDEFRLLFRADHPQRSTLLALGALLQRRPLS